MGDVDELNSHIGVLLCGRHAHRRTRVAGGGAAPAVQPGGSCPSPSALSCLGLKPCWRWTKRWPPTTRNCPSCGNSYCRPAARAAAQAHVRCRTVARRRAERAVVAGHGRGTEGTRRQYLNRLERPAVCAGARAQPHERWRRRVLEERADGGAAGAAGPPPAAQARRRSSALISSFMARVITAKRHELQRVVPQPVADAHRQHHHETGANVGVLVQQARRPSRVSRPQSTGVGRCTTADRGESRRACPARRECCLSPSVTVMGSVRLHRDCFTVTSPSTPVPGNGSCRHRPLDELHALRDHRGCTYDRTMAAWGPGPAGMPVGAGPVPP